ncbi:MAG: 1,4-beta-N-acetylmuramidase [Ruminococcus sp.]|nr:1,4-beta-N-acetylmuramidase [Ruminococcus sp.]
MATQGIDISRWQAGKIDFKKVKAAGYTFVIIRAGYGDALSYPNQFDSQFDEWYSQAKAAGLGVGAYWYTYAKTLDAAKREAKSFLSKLKGKQFDYPVYIDIEEKSIFDKGMSFCDSLITTFLGELEKEGYYTGIYCSTGWITACVSKAVRKRYVCWIADYRGKCYYTGDYGIWQDCAKNVPGVYSGAVDHDYGYVDYPSIIKAAGKNGYPKSSTTSSPAKPTTTKPTTTSSASKKKTVDEIAKEVIQGKWDAGEKRKKLLTAAGYDYNTVQKRVNELMNVTTSAPKKKSVDELAREVIYGKWSAGLRRKQLLTAAGYDYGKVQARVNELLK